MKSKKYKIKKVRDVVSGIRRPVYENIVNIGIGDQI
jgi:hypothetical protein